ncbi:FAD-dependent monooxygenase [Taibaiella koreensis]|uniref:FAD-dependent monooxygenase n=1 Tax=Taibaiella koreensis TaxID=1268548 RepID=UPI000E59C208|nr:FAD-dependent monooxygenase [Taibaiella koreensis]
MKATIETGQSEKAPALYDVIIAGAGPVGLFLACELALARCSVLILEKAADPDSPLKHMPFGMRGLNTPTIEALHRRDLFDQLEIHKHLKNPHMHVVQGPGRQAGHFAGIPFFEGNVATTQWPYHLPDATGNSLISEMAELETVLTRHAEDSGVIIKRGLALTGFQQAGEEVTVQSGDLTFKSRWLVGCDGSRSVVRKAGGFDFAGTEPAFTGYSIRVDLTDPEKLLPGRNMTAHGMYLQSQPGYVVIQDFDEGAFHRSGAPVTPEHVQEVLRRVSGTDVTVGELHIATTWTDRARQATAYHNGRLLLAGDAAHIHAPLGGQGLNLGLSDAMNLGWKLAATLQGRAPEGLLDSYYTERYPVGAQVLDWSRAQVAIMKPEQEARALYAIIRDLLQTRDGATYAAGRVWGTGIHYDLGGDHPLTGRSVPGFVLESGTSISTCMHQGQGLLIDFDGHASLKELADRYGDQIRYLTGSAKERLGLSALLVRPDGIVAWATGEEPDVPAAYKAADRWFVRKDSAYQ